MPKLNNSKIPRVLVYLSTIEKAYRDKLQGILMYAHQYGPWDIQIADTHPFATKPESFKRWNPDGVIREASKPLPFRLSRFGGIPSVLMDSSLAMSRSHTCVNHDSHQTAAAIADHFIAQGLKHFCYVGSMPHTYWSQRRGDAFAGRLAEKGLRCLRYMPANQGNIKDWSTEQHKMLEWLVKLPKPCGLMAALDLRAKNVLDTCLTANIRVPEDVSVIGVDNDETICENTTPTLSSALPDFERGGYLAAGLLDSMLRDRSKRPASCTYGIKKIVLRGSAPSVSHACSMYLRAHEFIRQKACDGIRVTDVVKHLKVSRRLAETRFSKACGHSLLEEIQQRRLEKVCELLQKTEIPISEIGSRCGYQTEIYLKSLFKRRFGLTMRDYRNQSLSERAVRK